MMDLGLLSVWSMRRKGTFVMKSLEIGRIQKGGYKRLACLTDLALQGSWMLGDLNYEYSSHPWHGSSQLSFEQPQALCALFSG